MTTTTTHSKNRTGSQRCLDMKRMTLPFLSWTFHRVLLLAFVITTSGMVSKVHAVSGTNTNSGTGLSLNWTNANFWTNTTGVYPGLTNLLTNNETAGLQNLTNSSVNLDVNLSIQNINFLSTALGVTVSGAGALFLNSGGKIDNLVTAANTTNTIGNNIVFAGGAGTYTFNSANSTNNGAALAINGNITSTNSGTNSMVVGSGSSNLKIIMGGNITDTVNNAINVIVGAGGNGLTSSNAGSGVYFLGNNNFNSLQVGGFANYSSTAFFTGSNTVRNAINILNSGSGLTTGLVISGANGYLSNSANNINVGLNGTLVYDNGATSVSNRFGASTVTLNGGRLIVTATNTTGSSSAYVQQINLGSNAASILNNNAVATNAGVTNTLTIARIAQVSPVGTLLATLTGATNIGGRVIITEGPTMTGSIIPWAIDTASGAFLSYTNSNSTNYLGGYGQINGAYTSGFSPSSATTDNVRLTSGSATLASNTTVNSLSLLSSGANTLSLGANTLTLNSGGLLFNSNQITTITNGAITVGSVTNTLYIWNLASSQAQSVASSIVDNGSAVNVVKAGSGAIVFSASNSYSGQTFVQAGALVLTNGGNIVNSVASIQSGASFNYYGGTYGTVNALNGASANIYASYGGTNAGFGLNMQSNSTLNLWSPINSSNSISFNGASNIVMKVANVTNTINVSGLNMITNGGTASGNANALVGIAQSKLILMSADGTGNTTINSAIRGLAGNLEINSGIWTMSSADRFSMDGTTTGAAQTFTMGGGTLNMNESGYGMRFASGNGPAGNNNNSAKFSGLQTGGAIYTTNSSTAVFNMGSTNTNSSVSYTLSGGLFSVQNSATNIFILGADTNGTTTTTFTVGGGTLSVAGTISGSQAAGAKQNFVWNGGTLSFGALNTTNLAFASNTANTGVASTFTNTAGNLLVGNSTNGFAGRSAIAGNYQQNGSATATFNILGSGSATTWAGAASQYSQLAVSGTANVGGNIVLNFGFFGGGANTYSIITSTGLTGTAALAGANVVNGLVFSGDGYTFMKLATNGSTLIVTNAGVTNEWTAGTATWNDTTNAWSQGINPNANFQGAYFGVTGSGGTVTVLGNKTISALIFSNATTGYTLTNSGSPTITLGNAFGATIMNSAGSHTITPAISLVTNLLVGNSGTLTLSGNLSGPASLTTTNAGLTILTGNNTYTGGTTLGGGTLSLASAGAIGTTGNITFTGGIMQFSSANSTDYSSRFSTNANQAFNFDLNGQNVTIASGLISSGGSLSINNTTGTGTLTLAASNNYSGATTLAENMTGTVIVGSSSAFGTGQINLNGGTLQASTDVIFTNGSISAGRYTSTFAGSNNITFTGNSIVNFIGGGDKTLANNLSSGKTLTFSGNLGLNQSTGTTRSLTVSGTGNTTFSGILSDGNSGLYTTIGSFIISSTGLTLFSGNNTFNGDVTINSNANLQLGNSNALGFGGMLNSVYRSYVSKTTVSSGGVLDLNGITGINEPIILNGTGISGNGALINNSSSAAGISSGIAGIALPLTGSGSGLSAPPTITISGTGSGASATASLGLTASSITSISGGTGWVTGDTVVFSGAGGNGATAVVIANGGAITGISAITQCGMGFTNAPTAVAKGTSTTGSTTGVTFTANASNFTVGGIQMTAAGSGYTGTPTATWAGGGSATPTLSSVTLAASSSVGGSGNTTIDASVGESGGSRALTKVGSGTLTLNGSNSYSGGTTISAGSLVQGNANALGATTGSLNLAAGTLNLGSYNDTFGAVTFGNGTLSFASGGGTLTASSYNATNTATIALSNSLAGAGAFTQSGSGTTILTGSNTYSGLTVLQGGVLSLGSTNAVSGSSTLSFTGGTLQFSSANKTDFSGNGQFGTNASQAFKFDLNGQNVTFASSITNTNSTLVIGDTIGTGAMTLSASNNFTGATTLNGGTLNVGASYALANTNVTVTAGTLNFVSGSTNPLYSLLLNASAGKSASAYVSNNASVSASYRPNIGQYATANSTNMLIIQSGGAFTNSGTSPFIAIGNAGSAAGQLNVLSNNGGTITGVYMRFSDGSSTGGTNNFVQSSGTSTFTGQNDTAILGANGGAYSNITNANSYNQILISGGTFSVGKGLKIGNTNTTSAFTNTYTLISNGAAQFSLGNGVNGTINFGNGAMNTVGMTNVVIMGDGTLGNGTMTLAGFVNGYATNAGYTNQIIWNGGVLRALASSATFLTNGVGLVTISNAGGIFDIAGYATTIGANITNNNGIGALTVTNSSNTAATLTLAGSNSFNGLTVNSATVAASGTTNAFGLGSITANNGGTVNLGGLAFTNSTFILNNGSSITNGTITNNTFANSGNVNVGAVIAGSNGLTQSGSGTTILTAANTYTGGSTVNTGMLQLGNGAGTSGSVVGTIAVASNAALGVAMNGAYSLTNQITGNGSVSLANNSFANFVTLNNTNNNFSGGVTLNAGAINLSTNALTGIYRNFGTGTITFNGGQLLGGANNINVTVTNAVISGNGDVFLANSFSSLLTLSGPITGAGGLTINFDSGATTLSGTNSYTGATVIGSTNRGYYWANVAATAGLRLGSSSALTNGSALTFGASQPAFSNNASFYLQGYNATVGSISGTTNATILNNGAGASTLTVSLNGTNAVFGGTLGDGTNSGTLSLNVSGTGTQTLSASNGYTGTTALNGGVLNLANTNAVQGSTVVANGGTLAFDSQVAGNSFTLGGLSGSGNVILTNTANGAIALKVGNNNTSTTYSGNLNDGGVGSSLTKVGNGTLTLSGSNAYTGGTLVSAGGLSFTTGNAFGVGSITNSATVTFTGTGAQTLNNTLTGNGAFVAAGSGTVTVTPTSAGFTGTTIVNSGGFAVGNGTAYTNSGITVNNGGTVLGSGTLGTVTMNSGGSIAPSGEASSSTANLTVSSLVINGGNYLWNLQASTNGVPDSYDTIASLGSVNISSAFTITVSTNSTTRWDQTASTNFTVLTASSFTGNTNSITLLDVDSQHAGSMGKWTWTNTGTALQLIYTANSTTVYVTSPDGVTTLQSDVTNAFTSVTAPLVMTGPGEYVLDLTNTYAANTTIGSGTLTAANNSSFGATPSITLGTATNGGSNATVNINTAGVTNSVATISVFGAGTNTIGNSSGGAVTYSGVVDLNTNVAVANISTNGGVAIGMTLLSGQISGTGVVTVSAGSGTIVFGAANIYSGGTVLQGGTLALSNAASISTGALSVSSNATVQALSAMALTNTTTVASSSTLTLDAKGNAFTNSGSISGQGGIKASDSAGTGTLTLAGSNNYTGGSTVNGGTLVLANSNALPVSTTLQVSGTGILNVNGYNVTASTLSDGGVSTGRITNSGSGVTLAVTGSGASSFSGAIGGTLGLTKSGAGTLTLGGSNTFNGATLVNGGGLVLNGSLNGTSITVTNATFTEGSTGSINGTNIQLIFNAGSVAYLGGSNNMIFTNSITTPLITVNSNAVVSFTGSGALAGVATNTGTRFNVLTVNGGQVFFTNSGTTNAIGLGAANQNIVINGNGNGVTNLVISNGATLSIATPSANSGAPLSLTGGGTILVGNQGTLSISNGNYFNIYGPGTNLFQVGTGGTANLASGIGIGQSSSGNNTVLVSSGGTISAPGNINIGAGAVGGTNSLNNIGTISANVIYIGSSGSSFNTFTNSGTTTVSSQFYFNASSGTNKLDTTGTLTVSQSASGGGFRMNVGNNTANFLSGSSSSINGMFIGGSGNSTNLLTIYGNATLTTTAGVSLGYTGGQSNTLVVNSGGVWNATGGITVGQSGAGGKTNLLSNNGTITATGLSLNTQSGIGDVSKVIQSGGTMSVTSVQIGGGNGGLTNSYALLNVTGGVFSNSGAMNFQGATNGNGTNVNNTDVFQVDGGTAYAGTGMTLGHTQSLAGSNVVNLNGGTLVLNGTLSATAGTLQTNSFNWNGGTLSIATVTATGAAWNGPGSISNNTLYNTNVGTLIVGNLTNGYAGKTVITGNYVQSGSATTTFNLLGSSAATNWVGSNNVYSQLAVSGSATLSGTMTLNAAFVPSGNSTLTILTSTNLSSTATLGGANAFNAKAFNTDGFTYWTLGTNATSLQALFNTNNINQWQGGTGTWDATTNSWTAGVNPNATNLAAYFGTNGAGGTVTVTGNKTNSALILSNNATGYTLNGPGRLSLGASGAANLTSYGSNAVNPDIVLNGQLNVGGTGTLTLGGNISGNYGLNATNSGTLVLAGSNSYTGTSVVNGGTVVASTTNSLTGWQTLGNIFVTNGGTLAVTLGDANWSGNSAGSLLQNITFDTNTASKFGLNSTAGNYVMSNNFAGNFGLSINGVGTVTLQGDNSGVSQGITLVSGGLAVDSSSSANALGGGSSTLTLNGVGTQMLNLGGTTQSLLNLVNANANGGTLVLTNGTISITDSSKIMYLSSLNQASNASITGGRALRLDQFNNGGAGNSAGVSTLAGDNSGVGTLTVNNGTLYLDNNKALGSAFWVYGNETLASRINYTNASASLLKLSSAGTVSVLSSLDFGGAKVDAGGVLQLASNTVLTLTNGIISGTLTAAGSGTVIVGGASTSDGTTLNSGTLVSLNDGALGQSLTLAGGVLDLSGNINTFGTVNFNGNNWTVTKGSFVATNAYTASNATVALNLSGGASFTAIAGTNYLTGNNTYSGQTVVTNGASLYSTYNSSSAGYVVTNAGSTFVAAGYGSGAWTPSQITTNIALDSGAVLAIDATGTNYLMSSSLTNGVNFTLGTFGTGTVTLNDPAANYGGVSKLTVSTGTLDLGGVNATNQMALTNVTISGGTITNGVLSTTNLVIASNTTATIAANLLGSNGLTISSGNITLAASNGYSGTTTLSAGTLNIAAANALGTNTITVNGGTMNIAASSAINSSNTNRTVVKGGTLVFAENTSNSIWGLNLNAIGTLAQVVVTNNATLNITNSGAIAVGSNPGTNIFSILSGATVTGPSAGISWAPYGGNNQLNILSNNGGNFSWTTSRGWPYTSSSSNSTFQFIQTAGQGTFTGNENLGIGGLNNSNLFIVAGGSVTFSGTSGITLADPYSAANVVSNTLSMVSNGAANLTLGSITFGASDATNTVHGNITNLVVLGTGTLGQGTTTLNSFANSYSAAFSATPGAYTNQIIWNGGVLQARTNSTSFITNMANTLVTVTNVGGRFDANGFTNTIGANITGSGTLTITNSSANAARVTLSGTNPAGLSISEGTGVISMVFSGVETLSSSNKYSGGTTVTNAGQLNIGNANALGTGALTLASGVTLDNNSGSALTITNALGTLSGFTYLGSTNLTLTAGGNTTSINTGTYTVSSNNLTISSIFGGSGNIVKAGNGTLILANTSGSGWQGSGTITAGTVMAGASTTNTSLGGIAVWTLNGGALDLGGYNNQIGALAGNAGVVTNSGGSATLTIMGGNKSGTYGGTIAGANLSIVTGGSTGGIQTLSGSNSFGGGMTIDKNQININNNDALGAGALTLKGGTIDNTSGGLVVIANALNLGGNFTFAGSTNLTQNTGAIALQSASTVTVSSNNLTLGGNISGSSTITKAGNGTLTLSGTNSYTGGTTLSGGSLLASNAAALGASTNNLTFTNAASTLTVASGIGTLSQGLVTVGTNATIVDNGLLSLSNVSVKGASTLTLTGAGTTTVSTTGNAFSLETNSTLLITNTYVTVSSGMADTIGSGLGIVQIGAATLNGGGGNGNGIRATYLTVGAGGVITNTYLKLVGNQTFTLTNGGQFYNVSNYDSYIRSGSNNKILIGSSVGSATSTYYGGGRQIALGNQSTVAEASNTVVVDSNGLVTNVSALVIGTTTNNLGNQVVVTNGGRWYQSSTIAIGSSGTTNNSNAVVVTGNGSLFSAGGGAVTLGISSGVNTNNGIEVLSGGLMTNVGAVTLNSNSYVTLGGGTLSATSVTLNGGSTLTFSNTGSANGTLAASTNGTLLSGNGNVILSGGAQIDANGYNVTNSAAMGGSGALTVNGNGGNGTLTLTGNNTYSGGTFVNAGSLVAGSASALGSSAISLRDGGAFNYSGGSATLSNNITVTSGTGIIRNSGGGLLTLSGTLTKQGSILGFYGGSYNVTGSITGTSTNGAFNSDLVLSNAAVTLGSSANYYGPTILGASTLTLGYANALPSSTTVAVDATSKLNLGTYSQTVAGLSGNGLVTGSNLLTIAGDSTFDGSINGNLGLTVSRGTVNLTGTNGYYGATTINGAGTKLNLGNTGSLNHTSNVIVSAGSTFLLGASSKVNASAGLELNSGTISMGGNESTRAGYQAFSTLTLTGNSVIDFANLLGNSALSFNSITMNGNSLSIYNWSGNPIYGDASPTRPGTFTQLLSGAGLSQSDLNNISFYSGSGTGFLGNGFWNSGEIVPVPEPAVVIVACMLLGWLLMANRGAVLALLRRRNA